MNNFAQFDLIVIGAGIIGSSTAYKSAKRGLKTLLLEQFDFLHHRGSSHGESRTIRLTYPEPYYSPMVIESKKLWREAEEEIGYNIHFGTEQLDLGQPDNNSLRAIIANCEQQSINHQILDRNELRRRFDGAVEVPADWIAVVTELGGVLKPTKAVAMFQTLAVKHGAVLKDKIEVTDLAVNKERGGISVISKLGQMFWGRKCVVTGGAWMSKFVKKVSNGRVDLPIQPVETNLYYWKIRDGYERDFTVGAGFPSFASYGDRCVYGTPALEFPDLIKVAVHGGRECDPDLRSWGAEGGGNEVTTIMIGYLKEWIRATFGDRVNWEDGPVMRQSCMYSLTPDGDFVIDFLGGEFGEDVVVAGGFSGHGFKMAPMVGRILVDLALGGPAAAARLDEEIKYFKMNRFEGNPRGNVKGFEDQVGLS